MTPKTSGLIGLVPREPTAGFEIVALCIPEEEHNGEEIGPRCYCRCAIDVYGVCGLLTSSKKATKKCKVVETKPTETTWIQIGQAAFKTQSDAEKQIKTVCVAK